MAGGTVIIDDPEKGGSEPGAWAKAFELTPERLGDAPDWIGIDLASDAGAPSLDASAGGIVESSPKQSAAIPPAPFSAEAH